MRSWILVLGTLVFIGLSVAVWVVSYGSLPESPQLDVMNDRRFTGVYWQESEPSPRWWRATQSLPGWFGYLMAATVAMRGIVLLVKSFFGKNGRSKDLGII